MTSCTVNLPQLLADLEALRIEALPLEEHSLAHFDTHAREAYATQLATLMLIESNPSDNQARLFNQLLDALQLGSDASPRLLQLAQQTSQQSLREFLKLVEEHRLEASFIVDGLVLCRLDSPLTETQSQVFSEYTQLMQVQETDLARYAHLAAQVLGLPSDYELPTNFDFDGYKLKIWKEFFYRELTQKMLDDQLDLTHGLWLIKEPLTTRNFALVDGWLRWDSQEANLTVSSKLKLEKCMLHNPVVDTKGHADIVLNHCIIKGQLPIERRLTSFSLKAGSVTIKDCEFYLKNSRLISKSKSKSKSEGEVIVTNSRFYSCGHFELYGGVFFNLDADPVTIKFENNIFDGCVARQGSAIFSKAIIGEIDNCIFNGCDSKYFCYGTITKSQEIDFCSTVFVKDMGTHQSPWGISNSQLKLHQNNLNKSSIICLDKLSGVWKNNSIYGSVLIFRELSKSAGHSEELAKSIKDFKKSFLLSEKNSFNEFLLHKNIEIDWEAIAAGS